MISKYNASDVTNYYTTPFSCSTYMRNKRAPKKHIKQMLEHHLSKMTNSCTMSGRCSVLHCAGISLKLNSE